MSTEPRLRVIDVHCAWGATPAAPQWNDIEAVRTALSERGVDCAFLSPTLSRRYDLTAGNDALAGSISAEDEEDVTLRGWLVIHPARAAESNALMRKHLYNEAFVGGALYSDPITGEPAKLRESLELINSFRRYGRPLLIETPTAAAMHYAVEIAEALGGIKVIASGMGGAEWHEAIPMAASLLNLYLDISGALAAEKIEYAISMLHGTRKLLYASGAPKTDPAALIGMLDDLNLSHDDRERILYTNAARLFHIGPASESAIGLAPMTLGGGAAAAPAPSAMADFMATLGEPLPTDEAPPFA